MRNVIKISERKKALAISVIRSANPVGIFWKDYRWEDGRDAHKIVFENVEFWFECPVSAKRTFRKLSVYGYDEYRGNVWASEEFTAPVYNHGDVVYSIMTGSGNGGVYVWDQNLQKVIEKREFVIKYK